MKLSLQKISLTFVAGCLGGLLNALVVWAFGALGLTGALGVQLAPAFAAPWLYQRLVWGASGAGFFSCRWGCLIRCGASSIAWGLLV